MRLWPVRRPSPHGGITPDDLLITEDVLRRNVDDVLVVRGRELLGNIVVFRGDLLMPPERALDTLFERFRRFGYTPFLRADGGDVLVQAWPLAQTVERQRVRLNIALFLLTCVSTLMAGAFFFVGSPTFDAFRSA